MLSAVEREIFVWVLHQSMSDRISCWYFSRCVLIGSSSNADVDFRRWYFSCDGQQRALRDSEVTTFCEQEPAAGSYQISRDPVCSNCCTKYRAVAAMPCCCCSVSYQDVRASGNTALSSPCWDLLATMRRVVNYHSSWGGQRQVELFDASGIWVWCKDKRVSQVTQLVVELARLDVPHEVLRVSQLCIVSICTGITAGGIAFVEMPPRRRSRGRGQFQDESGGQNEDQRIFPSPGRGRCCSAGNQLVVDACVEIIEFALVLESAVEMLPAVEREIFVRVLHQSMSNRVSCCYFSHCILVGSSSNADVDFRRWYFSCDGQQRALRDSEATTFCEQEPAAGITDSACKNQLVVVSVQYGPFNPYIPIRSTIIGKSRVAIDPIAMHTSWRSNSDIASVTSIGYPRMSASGESSTTMHRPLHASGSHPIPPPDDLKTNQYNEDLGLIHSTNGNHLESPNEDSSIDHQDARASGNTALSSPYWDLLATMRRVVNFHSSWVGQRQVELFDASGIRVWCKDERVSQVTQLVVDLARLEVPHEVLRVSQPKNLKFQNRSKPGPTSHIGPRTSRAARDRPEPNPRRIQTSRHNIAGDSPERRPAGGHHRKTHGGAQPSTAAFLSASARSVEPPRLQRPAKSLNLQCKTTGHCAQRRTTTHRPASVQPTISRATASSGRATCAAPSRDQRASVRVHAREKMGSGAAAHGGGRLFGKYRQSGPRPEPRLLRQPALEALTNSARTDSPRRVGRKQLSGERSGGGGDDDRRRLMRGRGGGQQALGTCVTLNGSGIQLAVGPQPLQLRNHNSGLAQRIMVERLTTSPHDPLGITDSACKNQSVVVSVQYGPFNPYIPIRSTTIGKSRVAIDPIAMHTSWRSNSDIASATSIGYPRMSASGESSTTMHRLLHASGSHPIPTPYDPKRVGKRVKVRRLSCRVSMTFRVVRTNQYNQDLGLIHSTNGNHLESPNEGSSIDHQVTIYLNAQNITMFPTNETWHFASQILVSNSGGLILILTAQSTRNMFRIHNDY
ncbi:hypothetical protein F511_20576 [Dorcoceras hygrometricum]|uniref:Uncharacterized protein n=1 Tax=Dorcoceras hygrometricum TaxID=472368 RepID=A0A2Z7CWF0_9LAMI|nr:hypothetical protein F511_20576 [Dorcoceras hygrometricum]